MVKNKSIAVAGKGGTGKSTIAALLILHLCRKKMGPVLAIDADPDANLANLLGMESPKAVGDLREEALREIKNLPAGMSRANYVEAGLHQVIEEAEGFDLITMGRGEGPGCYCYLNSLIRKFHDDLMPSYSWLIVDNEAGLEHISRRTTANLDALLVVVNENPHSLKTAARIAEIGGNLRNQVRKHYLVTNMVKPERKHALQKQLSSLGMEHLCDIPADPRLEEIIFSGGSLRQLDESPILDKIELMIKRIGGTNGNT